MENTKTLFLSLPRNFALFLLIAWAFSGCLSLTDPGDPSGEVTIETLRVPAGFEFETTGPRVLSVEVYNNEDQPLSGVPVFVYVDSSLSESGMIVSGQTDQEGKWSGNVMLESWRNSVVIHTPYIGLRYDRIVELEGATTLIKLGGSVAEAYAEPPVNPEIASPVRTQRLEQTDNFSDRYVYMGTYNSLGVPDYLEEERDPISQDLLDLINNSLPEGSQVPIDNPQYIASGNASDTRLLDSAAVWVTFVHEGAGYVNSLGYYTYDLANPPESTDDIEELIIIFPNTSYLYSGGGLRSGDKVKLGNFPANTGIGWFLVNNGWNGSTKKVKNVVDTKWSNPAFNTFTTAANQGHVALLQDPIREFLLLGMEDIARPGGDKDFNDAVFYVSANPFEAIDVVGVPPTQPPQGDDWDEDGVLNVNDNYPNDPSKAFDSFSPGESSFGSLAFEDLWPKKGDYDMNDVVVDYNYHLITNVANRITQMKIKLVIKALGGSLQNGFGIELNCDPSDIATVTGSQLFRNTVTLSPNGTEAGQAKAVVIAFDDGHKVMGASGGAFVNTQDGEAIRIADTIELVIDFANPIPSAQLGYAPFNPFIFVNGTRGREVHQINYAPTSLADLSYFGTEEDDSNPSISRYYLTDKGLPWCIKVPTSFRYPKEKVSIISAHLKFGDWVQSGGTSFADWYLDRVNYQNVNEIY